MTETAKAIFFIYLLDSKTLLLSFLTKEPHLAPEPQVKDP